MPEGALEIALRLAALFRCVVRVADDLGDVAFACRIAVRLNDQIEGFGDLQFDHFYGKIDAVAHMVVRRLIASFGALAWSVVSEPSCPVFMACSISSASLPRHSPTTIPVGAHAERIDDEVFDRHFAEALDVLGSCFKTDHMGVRGET